MAKTTKAADGQLDLGGSPAPKGLKIISLQAENLKRLTAVRIDPRGNLVEIRGRNAQGKSSVLDAIWWALAGAGNIQADPIRKGQERAVVKLDLGELVVTRTFMKQDDGSFRTSITVENGDGARFPSPQRMLDDLLGSLTFDPLAFARMKPKEQFDALKGFVPGVDFANIEGLNRADFEKRTAVNRRAKELTAQAQAIAIPEALPGERIDETALVAEIADVGNFNAQIDLRADRRKQAEASAKAHRADAEDARDKAKLDAIAAAKLPIDGLGFGDDAITLNGLPFEQASDAERLRASCAIAMASNPKLRVIRVRDGSLLDEDGMRLLGELADAHDCQVWVEAVDSSGRVGIVLEDGHVASTPESRAAMAQAAE